MIGSNGKVWLEGDCRDDVSPFHFQEHFAMCLSLFHNLLVDMLLGIIILLWIFLEFF